MTFIKETLDQAQVVKVTSSIFFDAVQDFDAVIQEAEDAGKKKVIIDLTGVEMICSSAITTLVKHHMSLQSKGGKLFVAGCNPSVKKILQLLGLDKLIGVADSVEAALK
ncbi:MAG TPA: STAS domain-containing protein [Candidatus Rifleibacterium sp.]|jgi:anti-anti-sigma factor|nr:STAS domain-containing protein [Candidatus Rifleibacterium sp.]HNW10080.1 STAS domain-containing protein [Candidatus Rifleibacterium sp.]HOI90591.1 STAS domain-containing protein [Candidatus Rifleibacterium sp.]HPW58052.1 STAS domain-containing protein [Candidatus Rifleibacterium sp.]HQB84379.1 STAS domain-containing protein [Candidatus Rifleibacterium sp.]